MERRGSRLAERFREALEDAEAERRRVEEERTRRLAEARAARDELLDDLESFGRGLGTVAVQRDEGKVTLRYQDRTLAFEAMGEADRVRVLIPGTEDEDHRLFRQPELGFRWVWGFRRRGREERLPLFDQGLEELAVRGLGLPRPGEAPVAPRPQPDAPAPEAPADAPAPGERPRRL